MTTWWYHRELKLCLKTLVKAVKVEEVVQSVLELGLEAKLTVSGVTDYRLRGTELELLTYTGKTLLFTRAP